MIDDLVGEVDDFLLSCSTGPGLPDFVVEWTAPFAGDFFFAAFAPDPFIAGDDTVLGLFPPICDPAAIDYDCNDDGDPFGWDPVGLSGWGIHTAGAGETVYIAIEGYDGNPTNFELDVLQIVP